MRPTFFGFTVSVTYFTMALVCLSAATFIRYRFGTFSLLKPTLGDWAEWMTGIPDWPSRGAVACTWAVTGRPMMTVGLSDNAFCSAVAAWSGVWPASYAV